MKLTGKSNLVFAFCILILQGACKKEEAPTLTTREITNITMSSASSGGYISDDGGSEILTCGVCWGVGSHPTVKDSHTEDKAVSGSFTSSITGLETATTFFVRAYATNKYGTGYGNALTITIQPFPPTVVTAQITSITETSAICGGSVTATNGISLLEGGCCWSKNPHPTIEDIYSHKSLNGNTFTSRINGLIEGCTTYYVRSFVIYTVYGSSKYYIAYGNEVSFQTSPVIPEVETGSVSNITVAGATIEAMVLSNGGSAVIRKGICMDTIGDPSINNNIYLNEGGANDFDISITGLKEASVYYVRAFATNGVGTGYGEIAQFRTKYETVTDINGPITDIAGNIYHTIKIGSQIWMKENLRTDKFNDNSSIPLVTVDALWKNSDSAYCWWGNNVDSIYGCLYNWKAVNTGKLCPDGWHVPSFAEVETLINFLGGYSVAGKALKEAGTLHWDNNLGSTDNASGFTALPGGVRYYEGDFRRFSNTGYWWTATKFGIISDLECAHVLILSSIRDYIYIDTSEIDYTFLSNGCSIRCIND